MKDIDVHQGLDKKEIRDFLSNELAKNSTRDIKARRVSYNSNNPFQSAIDSADSQIEYWTKIKNNSLASKVIFDLINSNGWSEHDISDYTTKTNDYYISFIGTEEEYNKLVETLNK